MKNFMKYSFMAILFISCGGNELTQKRQNLINNEITEFNQQINWFLSQLEEIRPKNTASIKEYKFPENIDLDSFLDKALDPQRYQFKQLNLPLIDTNDLRPLILEIKNIENLKLAALINTIAQKLYDPETSKAIKDKHNRRFLKSMYSLNNSTISPVPSLIAIEIIKDIDSSEENKKEVEGLLAKYKEYKKEMSDEYKKPVNKIKRFFGMIPNELIAYEQYLVGKWKREIGFFYIKLI